MSEADNDTDQIEQNRVLSELTFELLKETTECQGEVIETLQHMQEQQMNIVENQTLIIEHQAELIDELPADVQDTRR